MELLSLKRHGLDYRWASDVNFDGILLEILSGEDVLLDIAVADSGPLTINTFGNDVDIAVIEAALLIVRRRG